MMPWIYATQLSKLLAPSADVSASRRIMQVSNFRPYISLVCRYAAGGGIYVTDDFFTSYCVGSQGNSFDKHREGATGEFYVAQVDYCFADVL